MLSWVQGARNEIMALPDVPARARASSSPCATSWRSGPADTYDRCVERYVLRGGQWGYDRLKVLARIKRDETLELFRCAGVRPACGASTWAAAAAR